MSCAEMSCKAEPIAAITVSVVRAAADRNDPLTFENISSMDRVGAHLLLQVRTQVLNEDFRETFHRWYPGLKADPDQLEDAAA